ncbi:ClpXP adapter SpxH family protein [Agriterribacter sp.]|uniref:ClpXP adapter SpxH family protein n=1 Tax=Agriterribacter sp. TaxID=2821509 RepID=UPI002B9FB3A6|nr:ClpXP adapter SpxH family protein [Agriterribacter sp.]HRP55014.1 ClpXP adapter SpxH family protein [Agriterribacter sp.]
MNKEQINPMMCDPETGICEIPGAVTSGNDINTAAKQDKVRVLYFTDPICSSCWGIEPQLRKLKLEYGGYFDIEYRMGGLLKGWDSYGGKDVNGPTSVAQHWDEASAYYEMPIDGDLWLEDPLHSSYPPSVAFKAAQLQGTEKALHFLRRIKEMVFLEKKNITRWEHLEQAAIEAELDIVKFKNDFEGNAKALFEEDLALAKQLGVRGFPSIFFTDENNNRFLVYGSKPYEQYEQALLKLYPAAVKRSINTSWENIFSHYLTLTTKEFAVLTGEPAEAAETFLNGLNEQNKLSRYDSKNGVLWSIGK